MPTDFTAPPRELPFPIDRPEIVEVNVGDGDPCGVPSFPEDSDEKITVLFRLSLNDFVALASAIDAGSDIAYGDDGLKVYWIWVASVMCAAFCEEMATCFNDQNEALMTAVAAALRTNPLLAAAIADALPNVGAAVPGKGLTPAQSASNILPENVRDEFGDCIPDALWGACLYLVQSGNRAITDFFEVLEFASNTLEASSIIAQTIPAAGAYAAAAADFADQLLENFQEGYAAAYTEEFENDLACALFCAAQVDCELTPDMINEIMSSRLPTAPELLTFQAVMNYFGAGTFLPGAVIADAMFTIYFTALQFGQQFNDSIGIKPLTDLMSLGADQLASDNWETLCDCGASECVEFNRDNAAGWSFTDSGEADSPNWRVAAAGTNLEGHSPTLALNGYTLVDFWFDLAPADFVGYTYIRVITDAATYNFSGGFACATAADCHAVIAITPGEEIQTIEYLITGGSAATPYELVSITVCP